jgi:hypothetical protein
MEIKEFAQETHEVIVKMRADDVLDLAMCLGYLSETHQEQDTALLGMPGDTGRHRLAELSDQLHSVLKELRNLENGSRG